MAQVKKLEVGDGTEDIKRCDFGDDFIFGAATSAYQVEGATEEGGRGIANWDVFLKKYHCNPIVNKDCSDGKTASDSYHQYKEDVKQMKKMGVDAYRFSIAWPRILPGGTLEAGVNKEGVQYYNNLIDELLANGIKPVATLFHFDLPQALEDKYQGFLSREIVKDFCDFAEVCFWEFGDRVKEWITINEPNSFAVTGYAYGVYPPGHGLLSPAQFQPPTPPTMDVSVRSGQVSQVALQGKSVPIAPALGAPDKEPYLIAHHLLLAHAEIVHIYRQKYKAQRGKIGITINGQWNEPLFDKNRKTMEKNKAAAYRALDFWFGWFVEPVFRGVYPDTMVDRVGPRLPKFSDEESAKLKGSYDFLGLNYYFGKYATDGNPNPGAPPNYFEDQDVILQDQNSDGSYLGPKVGTIYMYPLGLYKLLCYIKSNFGDPLIYITENGVNQVNAHDLTLPVARQDLDDRVLYIRSHLKYIKKARDENGVKVLAYFVWSLIDGLEWTGGYTQRFGLIYVDYKDNCARHPKDSAVWFMNFLDKRDGAIDLPQAQTSTSFPSKRAFNVTDEENPKKKVYKR